MITHEQKNQLLESNKICRLQKITYTSNTDNDLFVSEYMDDEEAVKCQLCSGQFSLFVRRHHCRRCNIVYCDKCCPKINGTRVCLICQINIKLADDVKNHHTNYIFRRNPILLDYLDQFIEGKSNSGISRFSFTQITEIYRIFATTILDAGDIDTLFDKYQKYFEFLLKLAVQYILDYEQKEFTENADTINNTRERVHYKHENWNKITQQQQDSFNDVLITMLNNILVFCDQNRYDNYLVQREQFKKVISYYVDNYKSKFQEPLQEYVILCINNLLSFHNFDFLNKDNLNNCLIHAVTRFPSLTIQVLCVLNFSECAADVVESLQNKIRNLIKLNELTMQQKVVIALYARKNKCHEKITICDMKTDGDSGYMMACKLLLNQECNQYAREYFDYIQYEQGKGE